MTGSTLPVAKATPASPYRAAKLVKAVSPEPTSAPSPRDRLVASRNMVRNALMEIAHPPRKSSAGSRLVDKLTAMAKPIPGLAPALDTVESWWQDHRATAQTADHASQALIEPVAQRHPVGLVGVAAAAGAVLVLLRPWRLLLRPRILFGAASLIAARAIKGRSIGSWLQMAMDLAGRSRKARR